MRGDIDRPDLATGGLAFAVPLQTKRSSLTLARFKRMTIQTSRVFITQKCLRNYASATSRVSRLDYLSPEYIATCNGGKP